MNQILLTGEKASKCRKKIEKVQKQREAKILRREKFKLAIKNCIKSILKADFKAIVKHTLKPIQYIGFNVVSLFKNIKKIASNIVENVKINKQQKAVIRANIKAEKQQQAVIKARIKEEEKQQKAVIKANIEVQKQQKQQEQQEIKQIKNENDKLKTINQILTSSEKALMPIRNKMLGVYRVGLVFSIICSITFGGISAYATYDRNRNEEISKEILANITTANIKNELIYDEEKNKINSSKKITSERIKLLDDTIIVILNNNTEEPKINLNDLSDNTSEKIEEKNFIEVNLAENGETYYIIATISIPKINVNYPVLSETSDTLLKISPCKYWGGDVNSIGNLCIMGHNYVNTKFFSKVPSLINGDIIELTDIQGNTMKYSVYEKYQVEDDDMSCTSQMTNGNVEITLITCTNNGKRRVVVKARAIE